MSFSSSLRNRMGETTTTYNPVHPRWYSSGSKMVFKWVLPHLQTLIGA
uniref:Uncharacterized protein n=1 Tax=Arundo donax TaxID=35708 RepID=A0A0A9EWL6_ARUDO